MVALSLGAAVLVPVWRNAGASASPAPVAAPGVHQGPHGETDSPVCVTDTPPGVAHCLARVRTDTEARNARPARRAQPGSQLGDNGAYSPTFLQSAYNAPSATSGQGQVVAVVDAFDDPNAAADLAYYRSYFGLPACTTQSGCFRKVDQTGGTNYPSADPSWSQEMSLDLDMVSAICPNCQILLVEAASANTSDLGAAVNEAVSLGAQVVSNSYGSTEYAGELADNTAYFHHPGVAVVAGTGDTGYGVSFPAASPDVTAVGGTTLTQNSNLGTRDATETAWSGTGSGCSVYEPKPSWQHDASCSNRTVADVAADADPSTGVWTYDTYQTSGFLIEGGTSAATPIVGAMFALAANESATTVPTSFLYKDAGGLNDVVSGSNGTCGGTYLCAAGPGYDGPTGLGTPNGTPAFGAPFAISLTARNNPTFPNVGIYLDAEVTPVPTTGTVSFTYDNGQALGSCTAIPVDSRGGAFCAGSFSNTGNFPVVATYTSGSVSASTTITESIIAVNPTVDFARCDGSLANC